MYDLTIDDKRELIDICDTAYWFGIGLDKVNEYFRDAFGDEIDAVVERFGLSIDTFMYFMARYADMALDGDLYMYGARRYNSESNIPIQIDGIQITKEMYDEFVTDGVFNIDLIRAEIELSALGVLSITEKHKELGRKLLKPNKSLHTLLSRINAESVISDAYDELNFSYRYGYLYVGGNLYDMSSISVRRILNCRTPKALNGTVLYVLLDMFQETQISTLIPDLGKTYQYAIADNFIEYNIPVVKDKVVLRKYMLG